jgi:hypothetical protein
VVGPGLLAGFLLMVVLALLMVLLLMVGLVLLIGLQVMAILVMVLLDSEVVGWLNYLLYLHWSYVEINGVCGVLLVLHVVPVELLVVESSSIVKAACFVQGLIHYLHH